MTILAPGLHAIIAMFPEDDDADAHDDNENGGGRDVWSVNFADEANRNAAPIVGETLPTGAFLLETDAWYTGHSIDTPFGPLTSSELYAVIPVDSAETNFLPNLQDAYNWIVLDIAVPTAISVEGSTITVGEVAFDVADNESFDDCPGFRPACPAHTLADVGFSVVDDHYNEVAAFTAEDPEYGCLTFLFDVPRLDYDLQHIIIDDGQRAKLEGLDTPVARALLTAWDDRENDEHMCVKLRKDAPAARLAKAA